MKDSTVILDLPRAMGRMSQTELSERTGIHRTAIHRYYHDKWKRIERAHIEKICRVLECAPADLFARPPASERGITR